MDQALPTTPYLAGADSPLSAHARHVIGQAHQREEAKQARLPGDDELDHRRLDRVDLTWEEIEGQGTSVARTLEHARPHVEKLAAEVIANPPPAVYMVGCGDSLTLSQGVRGVFEEQTGWRVEPIQALDLALGYHGHLHDSPLVICGSSSGETVRTIEALLRAGEAGARTVALSNSPNSTLMREADVAIEVKATRQGWPTQASTAAMSLLYLLAGLVGVERDAPRSKELLAALDAAPQLLDRVVQVHSDEVAQVAEREHDAALHLFCGGGPSFAAAQFGAAKIKECTTRHGFAIPLEEYHHYNSQKLDDPMLLVVGERREVPRAIETQRWGAQVGGRTYWVAWSHLRAGLPKADGGIFVEDTDTRLAALVLTVPVQLYAYHVAKVRERHFSRASA